MFWSGSFGYTWVTVEHPDICTYGKKVQKIILKLTGVGYYVISYYVIQYEANIARLDVTFLIISILLEKIMRTVIIHA